MLLIRNGYVKTITRGDLPCADILVEDGKIAAIGEHLEAPEGCEVFEAEGMLVTPGLMDAHTHIGLDEEAVRWEGDDYNEMSSPVTPEMRGIDGINPTGRGLPPGPGRRRHLRRHRPRLRQRHRRHLLRHQAPRGLCGRHDPPGSGGHEGGLR